VISATSAVKEGVICKSSSVQDWPGFLRTRIVERFVPRHLDRDFRGGRVGRDSVSQYFFTAEFAEVAETNQNHMKR
jgi:hypothetical protein